MNESRQLVPEGAGKLPARREFQLPSEAAGRGDRLDLGETLSFFRRQAWTILGVAAVCFLLGAAYTYFAPKKFVAESTVMLTNNGEEAIRAAGTVANPQQISSELVDTQVEIITSRSMADQVSDALGLADNLPEYERREILDELQKDVTATRTGKSYALAIGYSSSDPQAAAQIANEFARQFVNWELLGFEERNAEALAQVQQRLGELRAQAQADTQALQQYRIANNLLSTSGASLTEQEISNYNQEVARARAGAAEEEARLQTALAQLRSGSTGDDVGEALGSAVISSLRMQEAAAAGDVADLGSKYGPNHPELIQAQNRLAEVRSQIQTEIGRVISNLRARREVSAQRLASLTSSLSGAQAQLSRNNAAMVGLSDLERAAEASQGIYESYLNRYRELLAAEGSATPKARILTLAEVPHLPSDPNIPLYLVLSTIIGLGLGVVAAIIRESMSNGVVTPDELEEVTGEHFLASIPLLKSVEPRMPHAVTAMRDAPNSAFAESFRTLETSIDQLTHGNNQVIALTSALPDEGKTITSCCLSYVLAQSGKKVMLIDCDLRRAGISRLLDMRQYENGLIEFLRGEAQLDLDEIAQNRNFGVLPLRPSDEQPEHLLTGEPFKNLIEQLRSRYDYIVLDLPPILPIASGPVIASRADATVLVTRWRKTSRFALRAALKRLPPDQVNLVGIALNQVDMRQRAYFQQGDPSFYYKQYREYYAS